MLGQQVVVDNRGGAGSVLGTEMLAKAPADGYTLVLVASSLATNPSLIKAMPYNALRDLAPISMVGSTPLILAAFPGLAICYTVLAFNLFGDGLRDILDPRLAER